MMYYLKEENLKVIYIREEKYPIDDVFPEEKLDDGFISKRKSQDNGIYPKKYKMIILISKKISSWKINCI